MSGKHGAKFLSTALGYTSVKISSLNDAFPGILELEASPAEGQQQQQKDKKRKTRKAKKSNLMVLRYSRSLSQHLICARVRAK